MKKWIKFIMLFVAAAFGSMCGNRTDAAVNMDGSVTINEQNFPDERFREGIRCCDKDGNGVLSKEERNFVTKISLKLDGTKEMWPEGKGTYASVFLGQLEISSYSGPFSIEGIGYFEQLTSMFITGFADVTGSASLELLSEDLDSPPHPLKPTIVVASIAPIIAILITFFKTPFFIYIPPLY